MNHLDLLQRLREEVPLPDRQRLRDGESRLVGRIRQSRAEAAARQPSRRRVGMIAGLTAGVTLTAVAGVAVYNSSGPRTPAPAPGQALEQATSPAPSIKPKLVSATEVLDLAATAAQRQPELHPRPNQFIHRTSQSTATSQGLDFLYLATVADESWTSVDGSREGAIRRKVLKATPVQDSPIPAADRKAIGKVIWSPLLTCNHAEPAVKLPTDPDKVLKVLGEQPSGEPLNAVRSWTAAGDILREGYLPPAQRAALFRALKKIPGTTVIPDATDGAGRPGISVARVNEHQGVREELVFDPVSYWYLGARSVVVDPVRANKPGTVLGQFSRADGTKLPPAARLEKGFEIASSAELKVEVTDKSPAAPHGEDDTCG